MSGIGSAFTQRLLRDAGITPGMRVLDVGCGSGEVSLIAAELVGPDGEVVGMDRDGAALQAAGDRVQEYSDRSLGPKLTFRQGDLDALPPDLGTFDAVIGRRVLMYLPDPVAALRGLGRHLRPHGLVVFQEHDSSQTPMCLAPLPLHEEAQRWVRQTVEREGADLAIGFHLHGLLALAGFQVDDIRVEAVVQTPATPYPLGRLVGAMLPRIVARDVATAAEIGPDTLQSRLDAERQATNATYIADLMFGVWGRKLEQAA